MTTWPPKLINASSHNRDETLPGDLIVCSCGNAIGVIVKEPSFLGLRSRYVIRWLKSDVGLRMIKSKLGIEEG